MINPIPKNLNKYEKYLLTNPPNEGTWKCISPTPSDTICGIINSGKATDCWLCRTPKPVKPTLLWPMYLVACKKVGIEPKAMTFRFPPGRSKGPVYVWLENLSTKWVIWGEHENIVPKKPKTTTRRKR